VGLTLVPPAYPTLVWTTPLVHPNWASGNQNQDIPKVAFLVATSGEGKGIVGVPSSLTEVLPQTLEAVFDIDRIIFIQRTLFKIEQFASDLDL